MRIGIYGGTFDPIHLGHLVLAEQCRDSLNLDEIWFVLAGDPPHKTGLFITDSKHREAMLRRAIAGNDTFRVDCRELTRSGRSYSVDTLQQITNENPSQQENVTLKYYRGGHMMYVHEPSLKALKSDLVEFYRE